MTAPQNAGLFLPTHLNIEDDEAVDRKHENSDKNVPTGKPSGIVTVAVLRLRNLFRSFPIMLDPLTSLGVASNIAQLVQFSAELVSSAKEIHQNGSLMDVQSLRAVASNLRTLSSDVTHRSWSNRAGGKPLEEEEKVRQLNAWIKGWNTELRNLVP